MGDPVRASCVHHPSARARRKCFHCLSPICPSCQVRALGHIFCSDRCRRRYWLSERGVRLREFALRVWLRFRRFERAMGRLTGGSLVRGLSLALLGFLLVQTYLFGRMVQEPPRPRNTAAAFAAPDLHIARDGNFLTVSGAAEGFAVAILICDGQERDFCPVQEGRFSFTFEPGGQERSLQVQVYGDNLPVLYSRAHPIDMAPSPSAAATASPDLRLQAAASASSATAIPAPSPRAPTAITVPSAEAKPAPSAPGTAAARGDRQASNALAPPPKVTSPAATPVSLATDMNRGDPATRMVAITFDGGSQGNSADEILKVLAERNIKATFFLTGEFMERFEDVTRRIARDGHEVGNHMFSHPHLTTFARNLRQDTLPGVTREMVARELRSNEELYARITGARMVPLWRAPYGEQNEAIRKWAAAAGYRHVSWTFDPKTRKSLDGLDWVSDRGSDLYLTSDQIVGKLLSFDRDTEIGLSGGIVLLHLGSERNSDPFHAKLEDLLDGLERKGYRVGSISEMLSGAGGGKV